MNVSEHVLPPHKSKYMRGYRFETLRVWSDQNVLRFPSLCFTNLSIVLVKTTVTF